MNKTEMLWKIAQHIKGDYRFNQEDLMGEAVKIINMNKYGIECPHNIKITDIDTVNSVCKEMGTGFCDEDMSYKCFEKCLEIKKSKNKTA